MWTESRLEGGEERENNAVETGGRKGQGGEREGTERIGRVGKDGQKWK